MSYLKSMGIGIPSIGVSVDGVMPMSLKNFMNTSMKRVKYQHSSLIPLSCVHILVPQVPRKNGGQELEALGRSWGGFTTKLNVAVSAEFAPYVSP